MMVLLWNGGKLMFYNIGSSDEVKKFNSIGHQVGHDVAELGRGNEAVAVLKFENLDHRF